MGTDIKEIAVGVRPGDVVAGKYRIDRILATGGMGVVVAAHHLQLDETVALKFLLPEVLQDAVAVGRFVREARAAAKIKGEHVSRVFDVGTLENGAPYIVMEYLDGIDLSAVVASEGPLSPETTVDFVLQACEAIASAHALGIVHRDLKPANLFRVRRPDGTLSIKVLDFGISKITTPGAYGHNLTSTAVVIGSPFYMSPEQMLSTKTVDVRTDIWSLGVILFELLVGYPPFVAESVMEVAVKISNEPMPSLRLLRKGLPPGIEAIVGKCLEKGRERRFQDVGELALALRPFASSEGRASAERTHGTIRQATAPLSSRAPDLTPSTIEAPPVWRESSTTARATPRSRRSQLVETADAGEYVDVSALRSGWSVYRVAALAAGMALLGGLVAMFSREDPPRTAATRSLSEVVTAASSLPATPPPAVNPRLPVVEPTRPPSAVGASDASADSVATSSGLPAAKLLPRAPPAPSSYSASTPARRSPVRGVKTSCAIPFVIDSSGDRVYKPECL